MLSSMNDKGYISQTESRMLKLMEPLVTLQEYIEVCLRWASWSGNYFSYMNDIYWLDLDASLHSLAISENLSSNGRNL